MKDKTFDAKIREEVIELEETSKVRTKSTNLFVILFFIIAKEEHFVRKCNVG